MVFTHCLIINQTDIDSIHNLQDVFSLFVESTENKNDELKEIQIECSKTGPFSRRRKQPQYIQQTISAFISGISPILFSGDIATFSNALQQIWNSPNKGARIKLKFRISFTPSDIENANDLTIVSIQKDFLPKWQGQSIIHGGNQEAIDITSHSEALFLGYKEENPFHNFLVELNVSLAEVQNYGQFEKVYANYISIEIIDDANVLRQEIRVLSKFSPNSADGIKIKDKFVDRLSILIKNKQDSNIKALRNIDWSAYADGERKGKQIVSEFIESEFENPNQKQFQSLSELVDLSLSDTTNNWWHVSISVTIDSLFKKQNESSLKNIWQLMEISDTTLKHLLSIVSTAKDCDIILRKSLPKKLKTETCKTIEAIAQKNNWYLLHADILLKHLSIDIALEKQLDVEHKLSLADSVGVKYIAEKLTSEQLIESALKNRNSKLIEFSVELILNNISLLKDIDLLVDGWLEIWTSVVLKTNNIFNGLQGKEQSIVFTLLDLIAKGKNVNATLVGLIADSQFSDISEYKNRSKIWSAITPIHKEKLLTATTQSVLDNLISGKIQVGTIESEISDRIISDAFMSKFLYDNKINIEPVITLYSSLNNLKDSFLADYISYFTSTITEAQAKKLGDLVRKNQFNKSARSIYDKAKYNNSFKPAYENCKELVTSNWWESILGSGFSTKEPLKPSPAFYPSHTTEHKSRAELPTIVILTAINDEYSAVRKHLKEVVEADQNDTNYEAGIFEFNGREIAKVVIRECGVKNTTASQETERAIQYFAPDAMFFVGIAGSRKPNDFSIGDVIFPEKVYSYEGGKSEKDSFVARPDVASITFTLMETAKKERRKEDWKALIKGNWDTEVKADLGVIASGEQVVEHYYSDIGKILTEHYNDTSAVEMEGFGFAKAANRQGRETSKVLIGIVRGISDIIEQPSKKKKYKDNDRRPSNAKQIASDTAAAFAFWLILKTYE